MKKHIQSKLVKLGPKDVFQNFSDQRFNKDFLLLMTVSNSTFRAFRSGIAYRKNQPSVVFRSWMNNEIDKLNEYVDLPFESIYSDHFASLQKFWLRHTRCNLNNKDQNYLLYKLLDLFFKHVGLYQNLDKSLKATITQNTMPPIDSLVLKEMIKLKSDLSAEGETRLLAAIPSTPSMGNVPRSRSDYRGSYIDFRKDCHAFFKKWAVEHGTYPICYDLYAWHNNSDALKLISKSS